MMKISCLLLAAGESSRMGDVNKLLLPIAGKSLVRRTAEELIRFPFFEIIVVTGHEDERIRQELISLPLQFCYNPFYASGMHSSIRAGLNSSLVAESDGFMVCLSDQPFFKVDLVEKLAEAFSKKSEPRIVFPVVEGKKGHPVFISTHFVPEILSEADGDYGCHYLFKRHPQNLVPIEVQDPSILIDVDTSQQYEDYRGAP